MDNLPQNLVKNAQESLSKLSQCDGSFEQLLEIKSDYERLVWQIQEELERLEPTSRWKCECRPEVLSPGWFN